MSRAFSKANGRLKPVPGQGLEKLLPPEVALKNSVIPLFRTTNTLTMALTDPLDVILIDNLKRMTGCDITPVIASKSLYVLVSSMPSGKYSVNEALYRTDFPFSPGCAIKAATGCRCA